MGRIYTQKPHIILLLEAATSKWKRDMVGGTRYSLWCNQTQLTSVIFYKKNINSI